MTPSRKPSPFPVRLSHTSAETLMWAPEEEIEPAAVAQLRTMADLPWVHGIRVMPDVHLGKGATVGSVVAMRDAVAPAAVGVDIGCGMQGVKTNLNLADLPDDLRALRRSIEAAIPVGPHAHKEPVFDQAPAPENGWERFWARFPRLHPAVQSRRNKALAQLGTLGGGNHFIEITHDETSSVWLMLHSGSRNIGNELASRHIEVAKRLSHNAALPDADLSVFLAGTPAMQDYLHDLWWAQEYAAHNRAVMMHRVKAVVRSHLPTIRFEPEISCHHNYVATERYDQVDLIVTRKGAIRAGAGDLGLIPGSMGTGSYVVRGLGNDQSYCSASHGAGRRMSRTKARRTFTVQDLIAQTDGVECRKDAGVVDEIPGAYKDLEAVVAAQSELVEVVARLTTLLCVKG